MPPSAITVAAARPSLILYSPIGVGLPVYPQPRDRNMPDHGIAASAYRMRATPLAVLLLLSCIFTAVAAVAEDTGVGPPPALAPGQAPPVPKQGPLAEPRPSNQ